MRPYASNMFKPWDMLFRAVVQAPIGEVGQHEGDKAHADDYLLTCDSRR
jgi:hypothetical protein